MHLIRMFFVISFLTESGQYLYSHLMEEVILIFFPSNNALIQALNESGGCRNRFCMESYQIRLD